MKHLIKWTIFWMQWWSIMIAIGLITLGLEQLRQLIWRIPNYEELCSNIISPTINYSISGIVF